MKWLIAVIIAAALAGFAYLQFRSVKTTYVNGLAPYTTLPGREYVLQRDTYIFKFKTRDTDWPLIGSKDTVPDLPAEVKESNVGAEFPTVRILGALRVGDHFRIVSVRRDESRAGTQVTFEILLQDDATRPHPRLDAYWIMDHSPEKDGAAPKIMAGYAVPLGRE